MCRVLYTVKWAYRLRVVGVTVTPLAFRIAGEHIGYCSVGSLSVLDSRQPGYNASPSKTHVEAQAALAVVVVRGGNRHCE